MQSPPSGRQDRPFAHRPETGFSWPRL